ncbi:antitermination protein NusG [Flavobacteriaceae bacterium (ex Bugula neritina AB1)]|nr:antitermination protein NusG [Flavobacteriaceae bacterium (ex Bugula neritina AB1)]
MPKTLKIGWYVLYVRSRQEKKVYNLLKDSNLEPFLPLIKTVRQWSDRKKEIETPLFPSYVFVKVNNAIDFNKALSVEGVCAYIRFGSEYAIVREPEILQIKMFLKSNEISDIETSSQQIKIGEVRKIDFGSLKGLECKVLKVNNTNKIIVRIDSLYQNIIATIPSYHMEQILEEVV